MSPSLALRFTIVSLFHLLFFFIPLLWTSLTSELFEFPKMLAVYGFAVAIGALWLSRIVIEKRLLIKRSFLDLPLILFFFSQLISTLLSINPHTSLWGYYSRFHGGLVSTICYLILYWAAITNLKPSDLKPLLRTLFISTTLACLYAFFEHFGHSFSCYLLNYGFSTVCWVQDVQTRVFGTFGQPNWLAAFIISLIFIPLASSTNSANKIRSWAHVTCYLLLVTLLFLVLLFTKSRSGLGGFAFGSAIYWLLTLFNSRPYLRHRLNAFVVINLLLVACYLFLGKGIVPQVDRWLSHRLQSQNTATVTLPTPNAGPALEVGGTESGTIRRIVWQGAIDLFKKYPLFGSGVETFAYSYNFVRPIKHNLVSEWDFLYNKAHNEWLNFLATTGLFGLGSYLTIMLVYTTWSLKYIFKEKSNHSSPFVNRQSYLISLISGYLALAVSNFFGFSTVPVALLFFLFPAFAFLSTQPQIPDPDPQSYSLTLGQKLSLLFITGLVGYWLVFLFRQLTADINYNLGKKYFDADALAQSLPLLEKANQASPKEPVFTDALSLAAAQAAVAVAQADNQEAVAKYVQAALYYSDLTYKLNPVHLNYLKTRVKVYIALASLDSQYALLAQKTLVAAIKLAPTDAKLWYNLGLLYDQLDQDAQAAALYQKTLELKPNYEIARMNLAEIFEASGAAQLAQEQYQYILTHINPNNQIAQDRLATFSAQLKTKL